MKIPGQADYQVNPDGTVTVDPLPGFTGTATKVTYRIADLFGQTARSTITVTVTPITPVALDDAARTPYEKSVTVRCSRTTSRATRRRRWCRAVCCSTIRPTGC